MKDFGNGYITDQNDVDTLNFDWGTIHMLAEEAVTGGKTFSFGHVLLAPGKGHVRHNHPEADEVIYCIKGSGTQMIDDKDPIALKPGDCCWIPMGVYHSTVNNSNRDPLELVVVYAPAGAEQALRDLPEVEITPASEKTAVK